MNLNIGIVGLPNAGKSTLFNALLSREIANVAPYPFCTIDPNKGIVEVPDSRLQPLAEVVHTGQIVPAVVEFIDIAGLVAGASKGEGLGNKFLANIRECSAVIHVLRAFADEKVVREGVVDPQFDYETIKTELCLADLQTLEKQKEPNQAVATKADVFRWQTIKKLREVLEKDEEIRSGVWTDDEQEVIKSLFLLSAKPALFVINVSEDEVGVSGDEWKERLEWQTADELLPVCAKTEMELIDLGHDERKQYLNELGLIESGLERLIKKAYTTLGLQTFLTAGEKEVRAWTIQKGSTAVQAAGVIHTDFMQKFIKVKVADYGDFIELGGWKGCADKGRVRFEGKDYVMREGDVVEFMIGS